MIMLTAACSFCGMGCKADDEPPPADPCEDASQLVIRAPSGVDDEPDQVASLTLDELAVVHPDGTQDVDCMLRAIFADVSNLVEDTTPVLAFGPSCVARIGDPDESEGLALMSVDDVAFQSAVLGEKRLAPDEEGRIPPLMEDTIFSPKGGETVAITVSSGGGETSFPGFESSIVVPQRVEMTGVEANEDGSLTVGWVPSDASFLEIKLTTEAAAVGLPPNRIRCFFLEDDGCFVVPSIAMEWLTSQGVKDVTVRMERHSFDFAVASKIALAEIDALRSIEFIISVESSPR